MLQGYTQLHGLHKKEDLYIDIAKDVKKRFDTSKYHLEMSLLRGENEKSYWINES